MDRPLAREDLKLGEAVEADIFDASGAILLRKGTIVESDALVDFLLANHAMAHEDSSVHPTEPDPSLSAFKTLERLSQELSQACLQPSGAHDFAFVIRSIAAELIDTIDRDPDPSIASIFLNACHSYSVRHQIHSAILSVLMAKVLEVPLGTLQSLVCGALTMNLAFLEYQDSLNDRAGALTDDERDMISKHPLVGEQMLLTAGVDDPDWLACVRHHHEKRDGTGYPAGLKGDAIPRLAQILQLVDVFSARISVRSWGKTELANATMADLLRSTAGGHSDPDLIKALIRALGAFPPGCFVNLANGETAIVVRRGPKAMTPWVKSLVFNGTLVDPPIPRDTSIHEFAVRTLLPHSVAESHPGLESLWETGHARDSEHPHLDSWFDRN